MLSFNIAKAEKIEQAVFELQIFERTTPVDIYLLQEMDEGGVQAIAKELKLKYLYLPVDYNKLLQKNIGNAILTVDTEAFEKVPVANINIPLEAVSAVSVEATAG